MFGPNDGGSSLLSGFPPAGPPSFSFGFPKINDFSSPPAFSSAGTASFLAQAALDTTPTDFTFGAGQTQKSTTGSPFNFASPNPNGSDIQMDSSWFRLESFEPALVSCLTLKNLLSGNVYGESKCPDVTSKIWLAVKFTGPGLLAAYFKPCFNDHKWLLNFILAFCFLLQYIFRYYIVICFVVCISSIHWLHLPVRWTSYYFPVLTFLFWSPPKIILVSI